MKVKKKGCPKTPTRRMIKSYRRVVEKLEQQNSEYKINCLVLPDSAFRVGYADKSLHDAQRYL